MDKTSNEIVLNLPHCVVPYVQDISWRQYLNEKVEGNKILFTDENIFRHHKESFEGFATIVIPPGESSKSQERVDAIIAEMLEKEVDKTYTLVAIGGGVVTDIAGYVASIYKRGIGLVQVPSSILAMVDAAIGGKNGVNVGQYKNMVGTTYQPAAVIYDFSLLKTLPIAEWRNGFAEIIKHACIKDKELFDELVSNELADYMADIEKTKILVQRNVAIKIKVVAEDELETGDRKLLNFGHTFGHAIEANYDLAHGAAISVGMIMAARISEEIMDFYSTELDKLRLLFLQYGLPIAYKIDKEKIWNSLLMDKKRSKDSMNFILLTTIGNGVVQPISLVQLKDLLEQIL